jgi:MinD-like ATPase involved in chromosome partitioning or flagellar assembly
VGLRVSRVIPQETDSIEASLLKGTAAVLIKPKSGFAKAIGAWVNELNGRTPTEKSIWQHLGIK